MKSKDYAADVPLICDPVPGRTKRDVLTEKDINYMRELQYRCFPELTYKEAKDTLDFVLRQRPWGDKGRTEWPDAEFCAA